MSIQHLWLIETATHTELIAFLAQQATRYRAGVGWSPRTLLNDVEIGFDHLVVATDTDLSKFTSLCAVITQNPERLRTARNRLVVIAPCAPALQPEELEAAGLTVKPQ